MFCFLSKVTLFYVLVAGDQVEGTPARQRKRQPRTCFSSLQRDELERAFNKSNYLTTESCLRLQELGIPKRTIIVCETAPSLRVLVSHTFVFIFMRVLGRYILFSLDSEHIELTKEITVKLLKIIKHTFRNTTYGKTITFRFTVQYQ